MYLEKWYGDWVAEGGVWIRYLAKLQFGPLAVGYEGVVESRRRSAISVGMRGFALPESAAGQVFWPKGRLDDARTWRGAVGKTIELWRDGPSTALWTPLVLNGAVGSDGTSRGYVERLTLNFAPWDLGIRTLRWGRFCGRRHSLVWIEWVGRIPKRLALLDGQFDPLLSAGREAVETEHARIALDTPREIVSESLGSGALRAFELTSAFAPSRFLAGVETKWLADARLDLGETEADRGHTVFEEVVWP